MTDFPAHGVLSAATGRLMGDISGIYEVMSYLLDRPVYTHELAHYGKAAASALYYAHPELPRAESVTRKNFEQVRADFEARHGERMSLDPALSGVLVDDKNPIETLRDMGFTGEIIQLSK